MSPEKNTFLKNYFPEILLVIFAFLFSCWLMFKTFGYDQPNHQILIATKAWSDFANHLPLIRSFSQGLNWPPQNPLFPGSPMRYHFLFYFLVGFLEKIGLPLNWAFNLPSLLGFAALLIIIYFLAKQLFSSCSVGFLSVLFFLFNGSFSFLEFFRQHPLSSQTLADIANNLSFPSFGPYDGKVVSAFWNLNIYTNQRHLAPAYFFALLIIYLLFKNRHSDKLNFPLIIFLIFFLGALPFFHKAVFLMVLVILISFFLYFSHLRRLLFLILFFSFFLILPQLLYQLSGSLPSFSFHPGYLVALPLTIDKIFSYWFFNLGLSLILVPAGFLLSDKTAKKVFLSFLPLFVIGNLFQFSPEIAANHKFFNLFMIVSNMLVAFFIYRLWQKNWLGKIVCPILVFFLIFSGIIDFFPIKNDPVHTLNDAPADSDVLWIKENTPPTAIFLNTTYLYHPASLAGRKIFLGWPYFAWSVGYDTYARDRQIRQMLMPQSLSVLCRSLKVNRLDYLAITFLENNPDFEVDYNFFKQNFSAVYQNPESHLTIYDVYPTCR